LISVLAAIETTPENPDFGLQAKHGLAVLEAVDNCTCLIMHTLVKKFEIEQ
jgi:hypothetical protein